MFECTVREIAQVAHEANRAYCKVLQDKTQPDWVDAPDWQQESVIAGVKAIVENPSLSCEQSHEKWMERKLREGWKWGEVKSIERMEHPCLKPYKLLPEEHKIKDLLFGAVVRVLMPAFPGTTACESGPHQVQEETDTATPARPPDCCLSPDRQKEFLGDPPNPQANLEQPEQ